MINQFLTIAIAHLLAVISPGPDFFLISRQSFMYGRISALYTSIGIAFGILFHILYCVFGLGYLLNQFNWILYYFKILCSIYLFYLGLSSIFINYKPDKIEDNNDLSSDKIVISNFKSFKIGFITNILNLKATLFFLSLYSFILSSNPDTSKFLQLSYGIWMMLITGCWFMFVSWFLTNKFLEKITKDYYLIINRVMGVVLIYIAIRLFVD